MQRVLRMPDLTRKTGLSAPTIYRLRRAGDFPEPLRLSPNAVGWLEGDVDEWLGERRQSATGASAPAPG